MNGSQWRAAVIEMYGRGCVAGTPDRLDRCAGKLEVHHLRYRSHGGENDPRNGVPLCTTHHHAVHMRWRLIDPGWLLDETIEYLAETKTVEWDEDGQPSGEHFRGFLPVRSESGMVPRHE
jgi:predicted restriction endonuclease